MFRVYLGLFSAVFFWGSAFVAITLSLDSFAPEVLAFTRLFIASIVATIIYVGIKKTPVAFFDRLKSMLLGMVGMGLYALTLNIGEETTSAGVSGFLVGQMPLIASVLAAVILKEKVCKRLGLGIAISLLGLLLITLGESASLTLTKGMVWVLASAFCGALYTCLQKPLLARVPTLMFVCHAIWGATLLLGFINFAQKAPVLEQIQAATTTSKLSVLYLACFPSIFAYIGWTYAISRVNIAKAGLLLYGMPVVGGLLAWVILKEHPSPLAMSGMALALVGSMCGSIKTKKTETYSATTVQKAALTTK